MQKARRRGAERPAPTACRRTVSGSLSLPCKGFFPPFPRGTGSLSVFRSIQPSGMVPGDSGRVPRDPPYSGTGHRIRRLPVRGCHPLRRGFPARFRFKSDPTCVRPYNPARPESRTVWATSPFDRHYWGNRLFLSSPPGTKMFQFPGYAPARMPVCSSRCMGCPIRTRPDQAPFAGTRTFSQLTASFVACGSQGILRTPLTRFS